MLCQKIIDSVSPLEIQGYVEIRFSKAPLNLPKTLLFISITI